MTGVSLARVILYGGIAPVAFILASLALWGAGWLPEMLLFLVAAALVLDALIERRQRHRRRQRPYIWREEY